MPPMPDMDLGRARSRFSTVRHRTGGTPTASVIHTPDFRWRGNARRRRRRLLPFSIQVSNSRRHAPRRTKASAIAPVVWEARGEPASLFPSPHGGRPPAKSTGDGAPGGRQGLAKPPWAGLTHPPARLARARARLAKRAAPSRRSTVEPARCAPARPAARIVGAPASDHAGRAPSRRRPQLDRGEGMIRAVERAGISLWEVFLGGAARSLYLSHGERSARDSAPGEGL